MVDPRRARRRRSEVLRTSQPAFVASRPSVRPRARAASRTGHGRERRPLTLMSAGDAPLKEDFAQAIAAIAERRDRGAFERLFNHFAPRVKGYMIRLGSPDERAEELAQETLLVVWRRAEIFDGARASAGTWIFTIARNLRIDDARRAGRRRDFEAVDDPTNACPPPAAPDDLLASQEDAARLGAAVARLSPDQRRVVREAFFADKPHSQVAADLGLPLGTVKSRLRLAFGRLRLTLERGG